MNLIQEEDKMKKAASLLGLAIVALMWALPAAYASEGEYVGADACGKCHKKKDQGEQLQIWEKSKHSKAFEVLGTDKAKEAAKKLGVTTDPQKSPECLLCHTTGYGAKKFDKKFKAEDGVQCEACHGAGGEYKKKKTMQAIWEESGKDNKGDSPTAKKTGFVFANEDTCKTCHSPERTFNGKTFKNPSYQDFNYKERLDEIKHPVPDK